MKSYEEITKTIIADLEKGSIPWRRPWRHTGKPKNLVTQKEYRGINIFLLTMKNYSSPYWLTYVQAKQLGGSVKKDSRGTGIIFWNFKKIKEVQANGTEIDKTIPLLKSYTVFNLKQCEGIPEKHMPIEVIKPLDFNPIACCDALIAGYKNGPVIKHEGRDKAFYIPSRDEIQMPAKTDFLSIPEYYSVLFHEAIHSTGHTSRLNRLASSAHFGSETYSKEELIAELGAAFLCADTGISPSTLTNSVAYIQSWIKALKDDKTMLVKASSHAQKAVDLIKQITE